MLDYKGIKAKAKGKGFRMQELAKAVGYSYGGFLKAINEGSIKLNARNQLSELLDIDPNEIYMSEAPIENLSPPISYYLQKTQLSQQSDAQIVNQIIQKLTDEIVDLKLKIRELEKKLGDSGIEQNKKTGT